MKQILITLTLLLQTAGLMAQNDPLWMRYSAISPDGTTIAFSYKGDIFTVNATGGEARQITTNAAYDAYPVWSPDSKRLAFASRREGSFDVFVVNATGGAPKRITFDSGTELPMAFKDNQTVLFQAAGMPTTVSAIHPATFNSVFEVSIDGNRPKLFSEITMEDLDINSRGQILYHNNKGYEDIFRKHHTSPIARDIYMCDNGKFTKMSDFIGENRTPRWAPDGKNYYYLSEEDGTFNVYKRNIDGTGKIRLTSYKGNPVRYLTVSDNGTLCFGYDGEIYTMAQDKNPKKVKVSIVTDNNDRQLERQVRSSGATEISVSPKNKEVAFVMHGDVYVTSLDYRTTKRITDTPEQERNIHFSPDGRSIVYASERNGVWQIYQASISEEKEKMFTYCTDVKEERLISTGVTSQCPKFSPDGKKVAFLENRGTLKVIDLKSKKTTTCMDGKFMYSYSDGDVWFEWSPDSRWFLAEYIGVGGWNNTDIALVKADGSGEIHNLTNSGYSNSNGKWVLDGKAMLFASDHNGYRSHGSWGAHRDAYIMFFDLEAYEKFLRTKEETEVKELSGEADEEKKDEKKEDEKKDKDSDKKDKKDAKDDKDKKDKDAKDDKEKEKEVEPLKFDLANAKDRVIRLTKNSSALGDYALNKKGDVFYYQSAFEGGYDLWKHDLKSRSTTLVNKGIGGGGLEWDAEMKNLYLCGGSIRRYDVGANKVNTVEFEAEFNYRPYAEREYMFDHIWQQVKDKFYVPDLHGVDWEGYRTVYKKFLPHINNKDDYRDLLSEMLGELNASHTGARYRPSSNVLSTAQLGLFYDNGYDGDGLLIKEVLKRGPFAVRNTGVTAGCLITAIDGQEIKKGEDYSAMLDGKAGKRVRVTVKDTKGKTFDVVVKPISKGAQNNLLYKRWVERNRHLVDSLSGGQLAYVHVPAMNSESFREVFSELLSDKNRNRKAAIVDERHNGGGWLHDDLCTFLSGKEYQKFVPHGQYIGSDPWNKWNKPSCVLICEDDYSNGHGFPFAYKTLGIGKLIGAPVAGTMTAVWWETLMDREMVFGIPQVGCQAMDGTFAENTTLHPDIEVYNTPEDVLQGNDRQLKRAVEEMMKEIGK